MSNNLANELVKRQQYEEAVVLYQKVLERRPDFWQSNYNLGYCYYKTGRLEGAESFFNRAIAIDWSDPDQYVYLGLTQMKMNRLTEAAANVRRGIQLRPRTRGYHFVLGTLLKKQGDLMGALAEFRVELDNFPDQVAASAAIAEIETTLRGAESAK